MLAFKTLFLQVSTIFFTDENLDEERERVGSIVRVWAPMWSLHNLSWNTSDVGGMERGNSGKAWGGELGQGAHLGSWTVYSTRVEGN